MEYQDDQVLNFKKKGPNKKKKKKAKQKTFEEIVKERQSKKEQEEQIQLAEEAKIKEQKNKKANKIKDNERLARDFELDLFGKEFYNVSINETTSASESKNTKIVGEDEEVVDERVLEYDFM